MKDILERLVNGELTVEEAENLLKADAILEFDDVAKFDIKRNNRTGFPEAIFAESKDYDDLILIIRQYLENSDDDLIITKLSLERYENILNDLGNDSFIFDYNRRAKILVIRKQIAKKDPVAKIGIITAGTSDINIAEEARVIVEEGGCEAITSYDIGVEPSLLMILVLPESTGCFRRLPIWLRKVFVHSLFALGWRGRCLLLLQV